MTRITRLLGATLAATALLAGTAATAVTATAAPIAGPVKAAAPGTGELKGKLQNALNQGNSREVRAAELEAGDAGIALIDQVSGVMASVPPSFKWTVIGPVNESGDTLTATLQTSVDGFDPFTYPLSWKLIDGTWKLSREGECSIASAAMLPCSL